MDKKGRKREIRREVERIEERRGEKRKERGEDERGEDKRGEDERGEDKRREDKRGEESRNEREEKSIFYRIGRRRNFHVACFIRIIIGGYAVMIGVDDEIGLIGVVSPRH